MPIIEISQLIAIGTLLLAVLNYALSSRKNKQEELEQQRADRERHATAAAERQMITDKLTSIEQTTKETRDSLRDLNIKLNSHSEQLVSIKNTQEDHERRIKDIERRCDLRRGVLKAEMTD